MNAQPFCWLLTVVTCASLYVPARAADQEDARPNDYLIVRADGARAATSVGIWELLHFGENPQPVLDSAKDRPIRWIRHLDAPPPTPTSTVIEFVGGDRLPARVASYERDEAGAPSCLLVEPATTSDMAGSRSRLRITTGSIQRVVWEPRGRRYEPGILLLRDGSQKSFRAARWTDGGLRLLDEQGTSLVTFDQIAEIHLPSSDPWQSYVKQLAHLSPDLRTWLVRVQTLDGLRITSSLARSAWRAADPPEPANSRLVLQPAWSLDPLSIACGSIVQATFFAPEEVPLGAIEPSKVVQRSTLAGGWRRVSVDSNIQGGTLRGGTQPYGWGLGVHAYSELEFPLPAFAKTFAARVGLDELAGAGGCVAASVLLDDGRRRELFASPPIVGSREPLETGDLNLSHVKPTSAKLVLVVDPLEHDRPKGADPLDIRDVFDWFEPIVKLDAARLRDELAAARDDSLPVLVDWSLGGKSGLDWRIVNSPRSRTDRGAGFLPMLELVSPQITLGRKLLVEPTGGELEWLVRLGPASEEVAMTIEVRAAGKSIDRFVMKPGEPMTDVRRTPLKQFAGREVELQVELKTSKTPAIVDIERLRLVAPPVSPPAGP